jgi:hemolysin activation/secretion protein
MTRLTAVARWRAIQIRLYISTAVAMAMVSIGAFAQTPEAPAAPAAPASSPAVTEVKTEAKTEANEAARFDIFEFVVEGNSVLATEDIERSVYGFMGEKRTIDDVDAARAALEKMYRDRGYGTVIVDIPEQKVTSGVITLRVLEGRVSRLRVTGSRYFSQGYILEKVPSAAEGVVPRFPDLQAQLGSVNRTADRRVAPVLRPGKVVGTTEVDLTVEDKLPLHGSLELNNHASPNTSPTRLLASLRYDNLWQRDHSASLQLQLSPQKTKEVRVLASSYSVPMGEVGQEALLFTFTRSDSKVAAGVGTTTVFGKGNIYGLRRTWLLSLLEREYHSLTLGADYKDFSETIDIGEDQGFSTPIRYIPWSANYSGTLEDSAGRWQIGAGLIVGVRGLVNRESQFADKRYLATGGFSVIKFDLGREQKLPLNLSLWGQVNLQFTQQPLISNEQFVAGGVDTVRGYLESSAVGDQGLRISTELRSPELAGKDWPWLGSLKGHMFVEGAALALRNPLDGQDPRARLMGAGFGMRVKGKPWGSLSLDLGWPLKTVRTTTRGDLRVHASGALDF